MRSLFASYAQVLVRTGRMEFLILLGMEGQHIWNWIDLNSLFLGILGVVKDRKKSAYTRPEKY